MIIEEDGKEDILKIIRLIKKMDRIDGEYVNKESDLIVQKQPFLISLFLGYRLDLKNLELEEIMKIIFFIWEYFKSYNQIESVKISEIQFDRIQKRNIDMLKYFEGEEEENARIELIVSDFKHLRSKLLYRDIILLFNQKASLLEMKNESRGIILVGLKSLIECFEEIIYKK